MEILIGIFIFFILIGVALKAGAFVLKVIFTILGIIVGIGVVSMLLPLSIGLGLLLLVPAILIGIVVCILKCIMLIF